MSIGSPEGKGDLNLPSGIDIERHGEVVLIQLRGHHLDQSKIQFLADEIARLIESEGCRKLVFSLSTLVTLYSELLAKLYSIRCLIEKHGGRMKLCEVPEMVREVFQVTKMDSYFEFSPDRESALRDW